MNPKIKALKFIGYALDAIEELRQLNPDGVVVFKTYSGKLAHPGIKGGDFESVIRKIESKEIASFHEGLGSSAMGWGSNPLTITVRDWDRFDKYYQEVCDNLDQMLNNNPEGEHQKRNRQTISGNEELLKLSPELYGVGINLKTLWRRIKKYFRK